MGLSEFLLARIAEDEAVAREALTEEWASGLWPSEVYDDGNRNRAVAVAPDRFLAECEAKRRIVELHALARTMGHQCVAIDGPTQHHMADPCATLRFLALPYADHPDYDPEWKP